MRKKRSALRNLLLALGAIVFFIAGFVLILNQPETIRYIIRTATVGSPWKADFTSFEWKPLTNYIIVKGLHLKHSKSEREIWVKDVDLKYRPLDILRGKLVISSLKIDDVKLAIPRAAEPKERKRLEFNITRLLILQNLIIKNGIISGINISLPKEINLAADEMRFELSRTLLGETGLNLRFDGLALSRGEKSIAGIASLTIDASTTLSKWSSAFPYLNALKGKLDIEDGRLETLEVDKINAGLKFMDQDLSLDPFAVTIKGRSFTGLLKANTGDQSFEASLDIPKPISLPYIGRDLVTVDTAGELAGSLKVSGKGFIPSESSGRAEASFAHRFSISPATPIVATARARWENGVIDISDGRVSAQNDVIKFDGLIDILKKKISLKGSGTNFPMEFLFDKFRNPHFHPLFGRSDVTASFDGWAREFQAKVKGTTRQGGYKPIVAELVETDLEATYDRMNFKWRVIQGGRQTGTADLNIRLGKKVGDESRPKDIDLVARLERHPLAASLSQVGLSGTGGGDLTIKGSYLSFTGKASAQITDGKWFALPFDDASANMDISRKKIIFRDIRLTLQKLKPIVFPQPLTMDLIEGGLRLWGTPDPSLTLDIGYQYAPKRWQIKKLSYADAASSSKMDVTGSIASGGGINLSADGSVDLKVLTPLGFLVREAEGPADIKLTAEGSASNPGLRGKIEFKNCVISPRKIRLPVAGVKGNVVFEGHSINFDNLTGEVEDGRFELKGSVQHSGFKISNADLTLNGKDMRYRADDGSFRMEFDGNLALTGPFPEPLLAGDITILDAKYTKDFNILESITKSAAEAKVIREREIQFSPRLDLRVRNTGDLFIKNNVGDIGLRSDLTIRGTRKTPQIGGTVNVTEGKIHYMGMEFDITRGFVEFRESSENPYIEVEGQREINIYNVTIAVHGNIDNLAMDLSATSPSGQLEKKDVISLIAFGMTEMERQQVTAQTGQQFGMAMAAQQLTHVVERPITKFAHLDTFRLEAADPTKQSISRIKVGKQLSDRLSVDLATDINTQDATQTVTGEYLFTDNLLLKGSQSSNGRYEIDGAIRFRLR